MIKSHRKLERVPSLVIPVAAIALLFALHVSGQQKKGGQKYLDEWVNVPFCGSVTITKQGTGEASSRGATWKKQEFGQLTANITGSKDVISERTGKAYKFFLEGRVNMTYKYHEVCTIAGVKPMVWDMEANGQKQHTYQPGAYEWTELHVNRARGLYRFDPPSGQAKGTMTYTIGGETKQEPATCDEWYMAGDAVDDVERSFDPEKGIISGFANFTWWNLLGIKDYFGREAVHQDPPPVRQSKEMPAAAQRAREASLELTKLFKEAAPELVQPVTYTVSWNLNLDTGACQRTVRIMAPKEDDEVVFSLQREESLLVLGNAKATPKSYEPEIYPWEMDDIEGSKKDLKSLGLDCQGELDVTPVKGPCIRFYFKPLPKDNAQFGKKTITADTSEPVHVKVFFAKFKKDNPEKKDANWFYYWKQGAVPGLEKFEYVDPPPSYWHVASFIHPNRLVVYNRAALCQEADTITLYERLPGFVNPGSQEDIIGGDEIKSMKENMMIRVFRTIEVEELKGVDRCHASVLHELKHKWVYDSFHAAIASGATLDRDGDGLPDLWEIWTQPLYQFDPLDPDTHFMRLQWADDYYWYGDNEVLCREAERNHAAVHELDWATPGKQSKNKDECNVQY